MRKALFSISLMVIILACETPSRESFDPKVVTTAPRVASKTVVLIHGMYLTPEMFEPWKTYFTKAGYTVHAPAWPLHNRPAKAMRDAHPEAALAKLTLYDVLVHYRMFIKTLPEKPILIGHSMGGLIVQLLLQENLAAAGVAISSAPPKGIFALDWSFFKSNWALISPFNDETEPYLMSQREFQYAFMNCASRKTTEKVYEKFATPESRRVGKGPRSDLAEVSYDRKKVPLLLIAAKDDNTIPWVINYKNFLQYEDSKSHTEFKMFEHRCHWIIGQPGWEEVARYIAEWVKRV